MSVRLYNQGSNGWFHSLNPPAPASAIEGDTRADWAVVGAGCCGLALCHRLAELRPEDRIVLVEAERVGFGASGRNSGFMLDIHAHGLHTDVPRLITQTQLWTAGLNWLRETVRDHQIQCDWSEWGRIYAAMQAPGLAHLKTLESTLDAVGRPYQRLSAEAVAKATASRHYQGGIHLAGSALVQPAALMRGLAVALPPNVDVFEDSPVQALQDNGSEWVLDCAQGTVRAGGLVLAAGAFIEELGFMKRRTVPLALYASMTRPLGPAEAQLFAGIDELGILPTSAGGSTVRLTRDRRIVMRNTTRYARYPGNDRDDLAAVRSAHREAIRRRWPALADIELEHTWGGLMMVTRNGGALFGQVGRNAYAIGTSDVSPVTRGVIAARLLAEHMLGAESELLSLQQALTPAAWLPPDPLLKWVVNHRLGRIEAAEGEEL